ncbi:hypothetical protein SCA03_52460 [Streptomyces cacaoi]|uniref:Uncharacterized protein n=1 Tax=Streptomyces cacaoi TaxID=1898 RepID=A0A4Y3R4X5_STRCI|nr:hypothetical protein SCA03_52460 [Streptomyces cacaoi]
MTGLAIQVTVIVRWLSVRVMGRPSVKVREAWSLVEPGAGHAVRLFVQTRRDHREADIDPAQDLMRAVSVEEREAEFVEVALTAVHRLRRRRAVHRSPAPARGP